MSNNSLKEGCTVFIQKEVKALEEKKLSIYQKIKDVQIKNHKAESLKNESLQIQNSIKYIQKQLTQSQTRMDQLKRKNKDLQNSKKNKIEELQHLYIQQQQLKHLVVQVFTPKTSPLTLLRLKLIFIESKQQLIDISHIFSIRNTIIRFLVQNHINPNCISNGAEMQICQRKQVREFKEFVMNSLKQNKLEQFCKVFGEPIQQYINVLFQIQFFLNNPIVKDDVKVIQNIDQSQNSLINSIKTIKMQIKSQKHNLDKINNKIQQNIYKLKKYQEYCQELTLQKEELILQSSAFTKKLEAQQLPQNILLQYTLQLQQLKQAIFYLQQKKIESQNANSLNSIKSMDFLETMDENKSFKRYTLEENCQRNSQMSNSKQTLKINQLRSPQKFKSTAKTNKMLRSQKKWK